MRTVPEVAKALGVSTPTAWRLVHSGRLQSVKVTDKAVRVRDEDINAYIAANIQRGHQRRAGKRS